MTEAAVAQLEDGLATLKSDLEAKFAQLQQQLEQINSGSEADLSGPIATVTALDASVKAFDPAPAPAAEPTRLKPTYIHDTDGSTEGWTASGLEQPGGDGSPNVPLWYFDADPEGADATPTGAVEGVWTVYTGPVVAAAQ